MSIELKIKSKHLGEEAKIIRFEERKLRKQLDYAKANSANNAQQLHATFMSLKSHRKVDVRNENRATFLARAYLSGQTYASVEAKRHEDYKFYAIIVPRVVAMVAKYGEQIPLKVYDRIKGGYADNPALIELKKKILAWAK